MTTAYGQTDALALAIVDWLTVNAATFCMAIAPERRFQLLTDLKDIPTHNEPASIDVFPSFEDSERAGISTAFSSHYAVHIFIQQQVGGAADPEAQCGLLDQLRSQIVEGVKLRRFQLPDAVHPVQNVFLSHVRNADRVSMPRAL